MVKRFKDLNYYQLLQVSLDTSPFEIRQAYKNMLNIYEESSLATYSFFSSDERTQILAKVEEAFLTLIDNKKRIAYDEKLVNIGEVSRSMLKDREHKKATPIYQINKTKTESNYLHKIRRKIQEKGVKELSNLIIKDDVISGEDLKNLREALGVEVEEIFQATKISPTVLQAIEGNDVANLPPSIYLKSFLKSYAEVLQLDTKRIIQGYLTNIEEDHG